MATAPTTSEQVVRVTVEDLESHLSTLEMELDRVQLIELVRGETVIAEMRAPKRHMEPVKPVDRPIPDFMGRMRSIWGDKPLDVDTTAMIREDRDSRG